MAHSTGREFPYTKEEIEAYNNTITGAVEQLNKKIDIFWGEVFKIPIMKKLILATVKIITYEKLK